MAFQEATREKLPLRMAISGPSKAGKTWCGLIFAHALTDTFGGRVAVIDTENRSASKYVGMQYAEGKKISFLADNLFRFDPKSYMDSIKSAERAGASVLVIDSLSHAWVGEGGILDMVDRSDSTNKFTAWKDASPAHRRLFDTIIQSPLHIIATMRSKQEYVLEENEQGKKVPVKKGLAPIQREDMEYEFDIHATLDVDHTLRVIGTRCPSIDRAIAKKPEVIFMEPVIRWLQTGEIINASGQKRAASPERIELWYALMHEVYKATSDQARQAYFKRNGFPVEKATEDEIDESIIALEDERDRREQKRKNKEQQRMAGATA